MPSSTLKQLMDADIKQSNALLNRYSRSSSLPKHERKANEPHVCQYRRDRVARRLLQLDGAGMVKRLVSTAGAIRVNVENQVKGND